MECVLLGTGGMMPMPYRMLTALAVRLKGQIYLFDAGEGTQLSWKKLRLGVRGLKLIAVTHLHADHCLGLPGLMMLRAQMEKPEPLVILGPPGIEEFVHQMQRTMDFYCNYSLRFVEWQVGCSELAYQDDSVRLLWHPLQHTRFCLGYRLEELDRPGKFRSERALAQGIPKGPLWGKLQQGETVLNEAGREVGPEQVLGPPRRGRRIAFVVDTRPTKSIYRLCKKVDIAFIEGMFLPEDAEHAEQKGHMTVVEAAKISSRAGAVKAVLVHISPRYQNEELHLLEDAARQYFASASAGHDLDVYTVALPD